MAGHELPLLWETGAPHKLFLRPARGARCSVSRSWPAINFVDDGRGVNLECVGVTLLDLNASTCRWPIGDVGADDFYYCGSPAPVPGPYCQLHTKLAYQSAADRNRWDRQLARAVG